MKNYSKLFLLVWVFTTVSCYGMDTEFSSNAAEEIKLKVKLIGSSATLIGCACSCAYGLHNLYAREDNTTAALFSFVTGTSEWL